MFNECHPRCHQRHFPSSSTVRMIWPTLLEYYQWLIPTNASKFPFHWTFFYIRNYFLQSYFKIQPPKSASCYLAFTQPFQAPWSSLAPIRDPQCLYYQTTARFQGSQLSPPQRRNIAGEQQMVSESIFAFKFVCIRCADTCPVLIL